MAAAAAAISADPHIPVLLRPLLAAVAPVSGRWLDGTFGAGGYTRPCWTLAPITSLRVDRDPLAFEMAAALGWRDVRIASHATGCVFRNGQLCHRS